MSTTSTPPYHASAEWRLTALITSAERTAQSADDEPTERPEMTSTEKREKNRRDQQLLRDRRRAAGVKRVSLWLDPTVWTWCHDIADDEGVTVSAVVTNLLHHAHTTQSTRVPIKRV